MCNSSCLFRGTKLCAINRDHVYHASLFFGKLCDVLRSCRPSILTTQGRQGHHVKVMNDILWRLLHSKANCGVYNSEQDRLLSLPSGSRTSWDAHGCFSFIKSLFVPSGSKQYRTRERERERERDLGSRWNTCYLMFWGFNNSFCRFENDQFRCFRLCSGFENDRWA
jgi:hypothetical protein